ncbi:MAG: VWA domain-containing protein [Legionellaceae bacterium]|nr:VWA domain-containing protein [Legionellaceae bacterium]
MLTLAQPWFLLLLPLPLLLLWLLPPLALRSPAALRVPFFSDLYAHFSQQRAPDQRSGRIALWLCIWLLLVLAVAGPRWVGEARPLQREGRNIMLALDLSGSMEIDDMLLQGRPVSRLFVVKLAAEQFVRERVGDRIGLILFGSQAYLQTPLTYDRQTVLTRLDDASIGLAGKTTAIGDALGLAVKRLQEVPKAGRVVILLTDGANNSGLLAPMQAAEMAREEGIKVYTIGLGAASGPSYGPFMLGPNSAADLDEKTLKAIANMTGGRYFRAADSASLAQVYATINQIETIRQEQAVVRPQWDYYPWLVAIALLLIAFYLLECSGVWRFLRRGTATREVSDG